MHLQGCKLGGDSVFTFLKDNFENFCFLRKMSLDCPIKDFLQKYDYSKCRSVVKMASSILRVGQDDMCESRYMNAVHEFYVLNRVSLSLWQ